MAKQNRPGWFKVFLHQKPILDCLPDAALGKAFKAAMNYFETGEQADLEPIEAIAFASFKVYVEEAYTDYYTSVENGKKGGRPPKPPVTHPKADQDCPTEADAEADAEADTNKEKDAKAAAEKDSDSDYAQILSNMSESQRREYWMNQLRNCS